MIHKEEMLIDQLKAGNIQAFNILFKEYSGRLYSFVIKYLKTEADTEELVQNVFYKIWKNRERLDSSKSFKAYIFTIAFNEIKKYFNKKTVLFELTETYTQSLSDDSTQYDIAYRTTMERVTALLAELSPRQRQIFEMSRFENLSAKEIAQKLGITSKTVDNQVSEVLRYLRSKMGVI